MTDPDRIRKIAQAASHGMPPPTEEERRYLLDCLREAYLTTVASLSGDSSHWRQQVADACRYAKPRKRCKACKGTGEKEHCDGSDVWTTVCKACSGTGYQEAAP